MIFSGISFIIPWFAGGLVLLYNDLQWDQYCYTMICSGIGIVLPWFAVGLVWIGTEDNDLQ